MRTPFKLRSGNTTKFKDMGSSPVKQTYTDKAKRRRGFDVATDDAGIATGAVTHEDPAGKTAMRAGQKAMQAGGLKEGVDAGAVEAFKDVPTSRLAKKAGDLSKNFDIKGYLKGEQGWVPDYKGESTKQTVHKVAKKVAKRTAPKKGMKSFRKVDGKIAKKITPTEVLKEGTEEGIAKNTQRMSDSFRQKEVQKQLAPLQRELDKTPRETSQRELIGRMRDEYTEAARQKAQSPGPEKPKRKITKKLKKKDNTAQENLNRSIQEGIKTTY